MLYEILEITQSGEIINYGQYPQDENGNLDQIHKLAEHLTFTSKSNSRFVVGITEKKEDKPNTISRKVLDLISDCKIKKIIDAIYIANLHSQKADQVLYGDRVDAFLFVYEDKSNLTIQMDGSVFCDFEECELNLFD
jgi:hypothetical protein